MLSHTQNERLTQVGHGTPMGCLMRRYWHPIATAEQLPVADGPPIRVKLLGQNLVLFRASDGQLGMLDEHCIHRGASLAIGRVEEGGGIRCLYHGWKFAIDGTLLETPNNSDCRFRHRTRATAYPVVEQGGLIWTHIGDATERPPFRTFASDHSLPEHRAIVRVNVKVNYLQLWEGGMDSSHVSMLHTNQARPSWAADAGITLDVPAYSELNDATPSFAAEDTWFGYHYAATRTVGENRGGETTRNIRVVPAVMPTGRVIPSTHNSFIIWETPNDDTSTSTFFVAYGDQPISRDYLLRFLGLHDPRFYDQRTCDFLADWANGFFQDRGTMAANWTGFQGIEVEDAVISMSAGSILDRSRENLVPADLAVYRLRKRLLDNLQRMEAGEVPLGIGEADMTMITAPAVDVPAKTDWRSLAPRHYMPAADC